MTTSCRDNAQRFLRSRFSGADGILQLWEAFVAQCPDMTLVAAALDKLAESHDFHRQPATAAKYRQEAVALRKSMVKVTA